MKDTASMPLFVASSEPLAIERQRPVRRCELAKLPILFLMVSSGSPEHVSRKRVLDPLTLAFQKGFAAKIFRAHPDSTESRRALAA
jgi:hypothetical protein